jgi:hypothetical protein
LGVFLDFEGAFDNTSSEAIITAARKRGLEETCCRWIKSMLEGRLEYSSLMGSSLTAKVVEACTQGGVLSPLLWNLVFCGCMAHLCPSVFEIKNQQFPATLKLNAKFSTSSPVCRT